MALLSGVTWELDILHTRCNQFTITNFWIIWPHYILQITDENTILFLNYIVNEKIERLLLILNVFYITSQNGYKFRFKVNLLIFLPLATLWVIVEVFWVSLPRRILVFWLMTCKASPNVRNVSNLDLHPNFEIHIHDYLNTLTTIILKRGRNYIRL